MTGTAAHLFIKKSRRGSRRIINATNLDVQKQVVEATFKTVPIVASMCTIWFLKFPKFQHIDKGHDPGFLG